VISIEQKKVIKAILGGVLIFLSLILFMYSYQSKQLIFWGVSSIIISIGIFLICLVVPRKAAYIILGVLNGLTAPIIVYYLYSFLYFNHIEMVTFILSLLMGIIGIIIAITDVYREMRPAKFNNANNRFYIMLILLIITWNISTYFGLSSPQMVIY
jgi:hypothetical protein